MVCATKKMRLKTVFVTFLSCILDLRPTEGPIKSPLSVCPSARPSVRHFSQNGSLVFSDFLHGGR